MLDARVAGCLTLVFALRDSAAAPKGGAARTSGTTLAGGGHPNPWRQRHRATPEQR